MIFATDLSGEVCTTSSRPLYLLAEYFQRVAAMDAIVGTERDFDQAVAADGQHHAIDLRRHAVDRSLGTYALTFEQNLRVSHLAGQPRLGFFQQREFVGGVVEFLLQGVVFAQIVIAFLLRRRNVFAKRSTCFSFSSSVVWACAAPIAWQSPL